VTSTDKSLKAADGSAADVHKRLLVDFESALLNGGPEVRFQLPAHVQPGVERPHVWVDHTSCASQASISADS
jgi:hypothetical protein